MSENVLEVLFEAWAKLETLTTWGYLHPIIPVFKKPLAESWSIQINSPKIKKNTPKQNQAFSPGFYTSLRPYGFVRFFFYTSQRSISMKETMIFTDVSMSCPYHRDYFMGFIHGGCPGAPNQRQRPRSAQGLGHRLSALIGYGYKRTNIYIYIERERDR